MAKTVVDIPRLAKSAWIMDNLSPAKLYHYRATITVVYDGDTCTAAVDLGFKVTVRGEKIRLWRINKRKRSGHKLFYIPESNCFFRKNNICPKIFCFEKFVICGIFP